MKTTEAQARVNGVHIMEIQIDASNEMFLKLSATYALVRHDKQKLSFETHGKCSAYPSNWSPETLSCLQSLIVSMEADLLPRHFDTTREEGTDVDAPRTTTEQAEESSQI